MHQMLRGRKAAREHPSRSPEGRRGGALNFRAERRGMRPERREATMGGQSSLEGRAHGCRWAARGRPALEQPKKGGEARPSSKKRGRGGIKRSCTSLGESPAKRLINVICRGKAVKFTFASAHRALKYAPLTRAEQGRRASACGHRVRLQVHTAHLSVRKNEGKRRLFVIYTRDHEESSSSVFVRSDNTARAVISAWYNAP